MTFATYPAHTGFSESVIKADAEQAAPDSDSLAIKGLTKLVETGTSSSATANRKLVMGY